MQINQDYLDNLYKEISSNTDGTIADYIPELKKTPKEHFAIAVIDINGHTLTAGDANKLLTLQSLSKPFIYGLSLEINGEKTVHNKVGVEPTGDAFNSIIELEEQSHRPFNPMINSGAIATTSLIKGKDKAEKISSILHFFQKIVGHPVNVDLAVYLSEKATGHRNRAITYLMKNFDIIEDDVEDVLDLYFQQCSILMSTTDMAILGATLANGGIQPVSHEKIFDKKNVKNILSLMMTCGMYDTSGQWVFEVGLPAKSGVSGVILAVVPGVGSVAVSSPLLDSHGHSVRGVEVIKRISEDFNLNIFMPKGI